MQSSPLEKFDIEKFLNKHKSTSSPEQKESDEMKSRKSPEVVIIDDDSDRDKKTVEDEDDDDDDEYGLISAVEQARQLLAASKDPLRKLNKDHGKSVSNNSKRRDEQTPATPGKQRRVELITLASPKTKIK